MRLMYVAVTFARPAFGRSSRNLMFAGSAGPPIATGTGASVCDVSGKGVVPSASKRHSFFLFLCTMSSAFPWSAVSKNMPPSSSTTSRSSFTHASHSSHAAIVAARSPVCPTMSGFAKFTRTTSYFLLLSASLPAAQISRAFINGAWLKGTLSDGISTYVSRSSLKYPERLPFQKNVTCPNFCVSEHANVLRPFAASTSPDVLSMRGGGTR
mmetsp:Transcript_561/g.1783  ORF Transcript_561/g.1783 Transcript_561/m.1783 type:complete len:211 (-) Transcript_561:1026-1658(-)